jgi:Flp pilus assembly pilin Flp
MKIQLLRIFAIAVMLIAFCSTVNSQENIWTQIGEDIDGEAAGEWSGHSVSLSADGSVIAIGAPRNNGAGDNAGHVRVYENIEGTWMQIGADIEGEAIYNYSGWSVSLSADGSTVAIGSPYSVNDPDNETDAGHVKIYKIISGIWTQIGEDIEGEAAYDNSGKSVNLSGDGSIVAIGAPYNDGTANNAGHVRVYENISGTWIQIGSDIDGEAKYDESGYSVSLSADGTTVAIGAPNNDGAGDDLGHVRVFENISGTWTQIGSDIDGETAYSGSQYSVSLSTDGSIIAIGITCDNSIGAYAGFVKVYENIEETWTQIGSNIYGEATHDQSGFSVSLSTDGSTVAIGAPYNDETESNAGHVSVYKNISGTWTQIGADIDGEAEGDCSGWSVSLSTDGSTVAIGATGNDGTGANAGHVRVYNNSGLNIIENDINNQITIYPNPNNGLFTVEAGSVIQSIEILTISGQVVQAIEPKAKSFDINIAEYSQGIYFIKVNTKDGVIMDKIVKE